MRDQFEVVKREDQYSSTKLSTPICIQISVTLSKVQYSNVTKLHNMKLLWRNSRQMYTLMCKFIYLSYILLPIL